MTSDRVARIIDGFDLELSDDIVGVWQIAQELRHDFPDSDLEEMLGRAGVVMRSLLDRGAWLGRLEGDGFVPWDPEGAVERALDEWRQLGGDPPLGEIGYFERE